MVSTLVNLAFFTWFLLGFFFCCFIFLIKCDKEWLLSWTVKLFIASGFNVNVLFQVISMHLLSPDVWTRVFYVIKLVVDQFFKRYHIQGINICTTYTSSRTITYSTWEINDFLYKKIFFTRNKWIFEQKNPSIAFWSTCENHSN